jgi:P4 family phage/plasmid primase-like protien
MDENRIDRLLGDDNNTEEEAIASLAQLARAHGAESRAADIVAEKALMGRFRFSPGLGWMEWQTLDEGGARWDTDDIAEPRVVEAVRQFIDETERDYRAEQTECESAAKMWWEKFVERLTEDERKALELAKPEDARKAILAKATEAEAIVWRKCVADGAEAKRQADIWLNLLSAGKISAITKLCRGMEGIVTRSTDFDAHPDLLNCRNGVVDLRTGELAEPEGDLLLTHMAGGEYHPGARSPLWDKALQAVPEAIREWFQVRMGQSITGHIPDDDALVVCAGGGENGKSACMAAVMRACGTYGRLISHRVLIAQPGQHPTELMDLRGLRFALLEETPEEGRLDTHQLKTTIGTPYITARKMRRDDVTFPTSHTLWVNTNFLPQVDTTDHGTWRRLKAMPWPFKFLKPGRKLIDTNDRAGDLTLKPKLATDADVPDAVLAWLVAGAAAWYRAERISQQDPKMVVDATSTWRATTDVGFLFATEYLVAAETSFVLATEMKDAFTEFLTAQGKKPWSAQTINTRLPDSLAEAGILVSATPMKNAKVRTGDVESRPPAPQPVPDPNGWKTVPQATKPWKQWQAGQQARMWRGVRFKTEAERAAGNLTAVS